MTLSVSRRSVFISYSHHDREWLDRLNVHLRPLVRESALDVWDDTRITPGSAWEKEIESALATAKVAILLITADFLASDFVARKEIPTLLAAARNDGVLILPLIISASRFSHTPTLSQFQAVNDPSKPLIGLSRSEQEEILVCLTEAVEQGMENQQRKAPDTEPVENWDSAPLLQRLRLSECLEHLGCKKELVQQERDFIRKWLGQRLTEPLWRMEGQDVFDYLRETGEPEQVQVGAARFVDRLVACCAPGHGRVGSFYVSIKKVSDAYRLLHREVKTVQPLGVEGSTADKLLYVHAHLLKSDRLTFLPARLLLGGELPAKDDEICYFAGSFTLDVDQTEITRVPGAAEVMVEKERKSMYGVVSNVFQNSDPFTYPLLRFTGCLGKFPVTIILSRKYIQFSSMTATFLAEALSGRRLELQGIGTMKRVDGIHEAHPLACGGDL